MRKFKLQVQTTVDGFMAGPNGEMDWLTWSWSGDMSAYSAALHEGVDCIVLGRKLAEGFIPTWASRREDPQGETPEAIEFMNITPRVVISKSLSESPWENATIASDLLEAVKGLKAQPGGDIIAYGGSTLVTSLIAAGLLDEIHLFVNPTAIGTGLPVFPKQYSPVRVVAARLFECGVTVLYCEPRRN